MLFASVELAARIEHAECALLQNCAQAIAQRHRDRAVHTWSIAGGCAAHAGCESPFNKVAGLGFGAAVDPAELSAIEEAFVAAGTPVRAEVATLGDTAVVAMLSRRGYVLEGFENVLGRDVTDRPPPGSDHDGLVVRVTNDQRDIEAWVETVLTGFATPDNQGVPSDESYPRELLEPLMRDLAAARGFVKYLALRDGTPVGGASARYLDGIAQLCGAATVPAHRRRGVQTALLTQRLRDATAARCEVAVITTQPGSKSQQNAQRNGFELLYSRAVLVRPL